jgi:hypothetical protein
MAGFGFANQSSEVKTLAKQPTRKELRTEKMGYACKASKAAVDFHF